MAQALTRLKVTYVVQDRNISIYYENGKTLNLTMSELSQLYHLLHSGAISDFLGRGTPELEVEIPAYENTDATFIKLCDVSGKLEQKKPASKISKMLKTQVWEQYHAKNNKGPCYACGNEVEVAQDWHTAHVIAASKGGCAILNNLRVCCKKCNLQMGNQNLYAFIEKKKLTGPGNQNKDKYFLEHPEQKTDRRCIVNKPQDKARNFLSTREIYPTNPNSPEKKSFFEEAPKEAVFGDSKEPKAIEILTSALKESSSEKKPFSEAPKTEKKVNLEIEANPEESLKVLTNNLIVSTKGIDFSIISKVWYIEANDKLLLFEGSINMTSIYGLPNGEIIGLTRCEDRGFSLRVFNPKTGEIRTSPSTISTSFTNCKFKFLSGFRVVLMCGRSAEIWNFHFLNLERKLQDNAHDIDVSSNGDVIIGTGCGLVAVYSSHTGKLKNKFDYAHVVGNVRTISNELFTTSTFSGVRVHNLNNLTNFYLEGCCGYGNIFVLDAKQIAVYSWYTDNNQLKIYSTETGKIILTFKGLISDKSSIKLLSNTYLGIRTDSVLTLWNFSTNTSVVSYNSEHPIVDFGSFNNGSIYVVLRENNLNPNKVKIITSIC